MAIDVGSLAEGRDSFQGADDRTFISLDNPANDTGKITSVEIFAYGDLTGCKVGTFYGTPPNFTCRSFAVIGDVTGGSKQTFPDLNIDVETGDYIGIIWATGGIEKDNLGAGIYHKAGDQFETGQQGYALLAGDQHSVYGIGAEAGVDVTIEPPLIAANSEGKTPIMSLGIGLQPPLVAVNSQALTTTFVLDRIFDSPVTSIECESLVPILGIDRIFSAPLVSIDGEALIPTLSISPEIILAPVVSIDSEAPTPTWILEALVLPPLVGIDAEALVVGLALDRVLIVPVVLIDVEALVASLARLLVVQVITSQYRGLNIITAQNRLVKVISSQYRKIKSFTSGG